MAGQGSDPYVEVGNDSRVYLAPGVDAITVFDKNDVVTWSVNRDGEPTVGSATQHVISDGDGATDVTPERQQQGTAADGMTSLIAGWSTTATSAAAPTLAFLKSGDADVGDHTIVTDNEVVGRITAFGDDGVDYESPVASIEFVIDGTPGTGDMPGSIEFYTTTDGGETLTLSFTVAADQNIFVANGNGIVIGHTAQLTISDGGGATDLIPEFQVLGTGQPDGSMLLAVFSTTATRAAAPTIALLKSGNAAIGSQTVVTDDEILGSIIAYGDDGTDYEAPAAAIEFAVDNSPGTGDMPGRIAFYTTTDAGETLAERWRIDSVGVLTSLAATAANAANVDGGIIATGGIAFTDVANAWIDDESRGGGTVSHFIGNQQITTSSDMRLKTDIVDTVIAADAVGLLDRLRVVDFAWDDPSDAGNPKHNKNSRGRYVGMLAQETVKVAPWIINAPDRDCPQCSVGDECDHPDHVSTWFVQYDHLVPTLVKSIQELNARLVEAEAQLEAADVS